VINKLRFVIAKYRQLQAEHAADCDLQALAQIEANSMTCKEVDDGILS
jgi:hypothetical protein